MKISLPLGRDTLVEKIFAYAKSLFPEYKDEQFMAMYGMLTGTASTGIMLLREIDGDFISPASDNLIYQQFPAIAFGFPLMLLANLAPSEPYLTFAILVAFFIVMNIILFRSKIFKRKKPLAEVPLGETAVTDKTDE
jgi:ESS family glutamate:Na+ symporter